MLLAGDIGGTKTVLGLYTTERGALALAAAAKAHAFVENHTGVYPDDIQAVFAAIAGHRLKPAGNTSYRFATELSQYVLDSVAIP